MNLRNLVWSAWAFQDSGEDYPKVVVCSIVPGLLKSQILVKEELISFSYTPLGMHNKKHCFH